MRSALTVLARGSRGGQALRVLRHLVMWNITAFGDPDLARYSFAALKELRAELAR